MNGHSRPTRKVIIYFEAARPAPRKRITKSNGKDIQSRFMEHQALQAFASEGSLEIFILADEAKKKKMRFLVKEEENSWLGF